MLNANTQLFIADFDGNLFDTLHPPKGGMSVKGAYEESIWKMWGEAGINTFRNIGGLSNRAPSELIDLMLQINTDLRKDFERLIPSLGEQFKGATAAMVYTEVLIKKKLEILMKQIQRLPDGTMWPPPTTGAFEFLDWIAKQDHLRLAIISSGHREFIEKTFGIAGLEQPDFMVTEDDVRYRKYPEDVMMRVKPATLPLALVHAWWRELKGTNSDYGDFHLNAATERRQFVYTGDDVKDQNMALQGEITFGLFRPHDPQLKSDTYEGSFTFGDWRDIRQVLDTHELQLKKGVPIGDFLVREAGGIPMEGLRRRL